MDDLNNNVERIIKETMHSSASVGGMALSEGCFAWFGTFDRPGSLELEPIVFRDVFALYGASDIRGSSEARNRAIQADITGHLNLDRATSSAQLNGSSHSIS